MPLTLEQYAEYLDSRGQLWPSPPELKQPKARPHLVSLPHIRMVTWSLYGTLMRLAGGQLYFEHPQKFNMDLALDKTQQEFKMWQSMTRKPGQPADQLKSMFLRAYQDQKTLPSPGERYPEILAERIWQSIFDKLLKKDYKFDAGFFGSLDDLSRKAAFFFHASLQGTACLPETGPVLQEVRSRGFLQGLIADGQCFTMVQFQRALKQQGFETPWQRLFDPDLCALSHEHRARKPSERLFKVVLSALNKRGLLPEQVLHVGSRVSLDVAPARKLGMRTALFAGDKESLEASPEELKNPATRPDVLLTHLSQIMEILPEAA